VEIVSPRRFASDISHLHSRARTSSIGSFRFVTTTPISLFGSMKK
jgi:hypothetical protein